MASNYGVGKSTDNERMPVVQAPSPVLSLSRYNSENGAVSSVVTLHPNTTSLEIGATAGQGVVIKWIPLTDTTQASVVSSGLGANFDHWIPAGTYRQFVVPKETQGAPLTAGAQYGSVFGLYKRVAWISKGGPSSVVATEY